MASPRGSFIDFYRTQYRNEHKIAANVFFHLIGVAAGLATITASLTIWPIWSILLFPVAHAVPGLIGHRLFERDASVGDVRVFRSDVPGWWFLIANHMLAVDILIPGRPFGLPR
jgi:hypothetical protein